MIGRLPLPVEYLEWNERWGAPFGLPAAQHVSLRQRMVEPRKEYGPFAYQIFSGTRTFEYPWAYYAAGTTPGMRVLEAGGGLSGLQFVFATEGCDVVNVDPYIDTDNGFATSMQAWSNTPESHQRLNDAFGTDVTLIRKRLQDAELAEGSFHRVLCLSVLEHLEPAEARDMVEHAVRLLAPGGLLVATIDLFFDLEPFGVLKRNSYGTNIDVAKLVDDLGVDLVHGDPRELYGFDCFDRERIVADVDELFFSPNYPVVTQTLILRKPE
jgi:2-polyprenyl-3-methyl-5-hydroxy-6-metoxy-1,4-benzoquinol methylase